MASSWVWFGAFDFLGDTRVDRAQGWHLMVCGFPMTIGN